jgi:hypothetical protein
MKLIDFGGEYMNIEIIKAFAAYDYIMKTEEGNQNYETALNHLNALHREINRWDGETDPLFIDGIDNNNFFIGVGADSFAAGGSGAKTGQPNFKRFIQDDVYRKKIKDLLLIRKISTNKNDDLLNEINRINIHEDLYEFEGNPRPIILVNRMMLMIFPELFTTIADVDKMRATALKLDVDVNHLDNIKDFPTIQYKIKQKVKSCLENEGLKGKLHPLAEASIAWYIINH